MIKPFEYWVIVYAPYSTIYQGTNFRTKELAIRHHSNQRGIPWKTCYNRGDRAVKVSIVDWNRKEERARIRKWRQENEKR